MPTANNISDPAGGGAAVPARQQRPLPGEAPVRQPGRMQAFLLLICASLNVLVTAVLGPSLPAMQAHFKGVPGAEYLVPLSVTTPMLVLALLSVFVGMTVDRFGRKRLLVAGTALYGIVGTAPLYLDSLAAILASRVALGVAEAIVMTVGTVMIGDYYSGPRRGRMIALSVTVASISAFVIGNLGGAIAEHGWRAPYAVYAISFVLAPLMALYLWEPQRGLAHGEAGTEVGDMPFRPLLLGLICVLGMLTGIVHMTLLVHFGYLFNAIGVTSPSQVGMAYGINSLGVTAGTLLFGWVLAPRATVALQLALGAFIAALALILMKGVSTYAALAAMGMLNGVGVGILLPTMTTWTMRSVPLAKRGFGNGAFQAALFFGVFLNPLLVVGLQERMGGTRAAAVAVIGMVLMVLAGVALVVAILGRQRGAPTSVVGVAPSS